VGALLLLAGCKGCREPVPDSPVPDSPADDSSDETADTGAGPTSRELRVRVLLDGEPAPDTTVLQGGADGRWTTDANGEVTITVDLTVIGDIEVMASRSDARIQGLIVHDSDYNTGEGDTAGPFVVSISRFDTSDNPEYTFLDPGDVPWEESNTTMCMHCHRTLHEEWTLSPHRTSASNAVVQDVYQGTAFALDAEDCAELGEWASVQTPGATTQQDACVVADDARSHAGFGGCADCHAPGIDGAIGGRDLLDATGFAYDDGVHCDVCHRVEAVDLSQAPWVAGALHLLRPTEVPNSSALGEWSPLTFGPWDDVPNPKMGAVQRSFYHEAELCGGCHQDVSAPAAGPVDTTRWPDGRLPIHTTYGEWEEGPMSLSSPCQTCHMPPNPEMTNAADLPADATSGIGVTGGWFRDPGSVRAHTFSGPRQPEGAMLELAATVSVALAEADGELVATVETKNVAAGHRIPTGEPMRALLLEVSATCDGAPLAAIGGDVLPAWAGAVEARTSDEPWAAWTTASPGDRIAVTTDTGVAVDYDGYGPFGDGTFTADEKGLGGAELVGVVTITDVAADGTLTTDPPLPAGDHAYLLSDDQALAGTPGWAFARVTADAEGDVFVPHAFATDIVSDNRLAPQEAWVSSHRFPTCASGAVVTATLVHRNYPWGEARLRGWTVTDQVMDTETAWQ